LPDIELTHIYERIIDVMRALQRNELASERHAQAMAAGHAVDSSSPAATGEALGHGTGVEQPKRQTPVAGRATEAPETGTKQ